MYIFYTILSFLLVLTLAEDKSSQNDFESAKNFFEEQSDKMRQFFLEQRDKMEKAINSTYESAVDMKNSVDEFVDSQNKKISSNISRYMNDMLDAMDPWAKNKNESDDIFSSDPDIVLSVPAIITRNGYNCETHTIISQGYILNVHRMLPKNKQPTLKTVLLQHGFLASSADWVMNGPNKSLAYSLVDAGYDVWMSNMRGNRYSKEHLWLNLDSKEYWNFSWHDVALYDIPNIIDYILQIKGENAKINYIGHSMGTTILFSMLSIKLEYNEILTSCVALAPVVFFQDFRSPLKSIMPFANNLAYMENLYGSHEFILKTSALGKSLAACEIDKLNLDLCTNILFYICGISEKQFDKNKTMMFLSHLGRGTSWKVVVHFAQQMDSGGRFQMFDYGAQRNNEMYGSSTPQKYDLSKITAPIALFWSKNDLLSSETDVRTLHKSVVSSEMYLTPDPQFNHLDYLIGKDTPILNKKILEVLDKHNLKSTETTGFGLSFRFG